MAKYKLMHDNNEIDFTTIPDFSDLKQGELKDTIKFTGCFKNEDELRRYVSKYKLINFAGSFDVKYKYKKELKSLKYGLTFKEDVPFIDYKNIISFLYENHDNIDLLDCIVRHYFNPYSNNQSNIIMIKNYLKLLRHDTLASFDEAEIKKDFSFALKDFVKKECVRYNKSKQEYVGSLKNLRDLGMLLSKMAKMDQSLKTSTMKYKNDISEYIDSKNIVVDGEPGTIKVLGKTKTKKKDNIPGQMTFKVSKDGTITY